MFKQSLCTAVDMPLWTRGEANVLRKSWNFRSAGSLTSPVPLPMRQPVTNQPFLTIRQRSHVINNLFHNYLSGWEPMAFLVFLLPMVIELLATSRSSIAIASASSRLGAVPRTDADRPHHRPEVTIDMFRNLPFDGLEKTLEFFRNFADGNRNASMLISISYYNAYGHTTLFLFDNLHHQNSLNRSV
jgi:hypothetical protein